MARETYFQWPYSLEYAVDSPPTVNLLHGSPLSEWPAYEATVTPDALAAPGGDVSADLILETTATSSHFLDKPVAVLPNTDYTLSVYLHAQDRTYACLHALGDETTAWAYFDLAVGGWGAASGVDATCVSDEGDGWFRCSFTFNSGADTLIGVGVAPSVAGSSCWSDEYAGDAAKGIYATLPQLEPVNLLCAATEVSAWAPRAATLGAGGLIRETVAHSLHVAERRVGVSPYTGHALSVVVEARGRTHACLSAFGDMTAAWAFFDLSAGTVGESGGVTAPACVALGGGRYRCSFAFTTAGDTAVYVGIAPATGPACLDDTYAGDPARGIAASAPTLRPATVPTDAIPCYVVPFTVAWKPGMRQDFRDLRFRDEGMEPCTHRLESYTAGTTATFLIEIRPGQERLSVLYGNGAAVSASDDTFCPVLDAFSGAAVDTAIWTDLGGTAVSGGTLTITGGFGEFGVSSIAALGIGTELRARLTYTPGSASYTEIGYGGYGSDYALLVYGTTLATYTRNDAMGESTALALPAGYHTLAIRRASASAVVFLIDGVAVATHDEQIPDAAVPIHIVSTYNIGASMALDWITVRPCLAIEPTITYTGADCNPWSPLVNRPAALFDVPFDWSDFDAVKERALVSYTVRRSASDVMYSADVTIHDLVPQGTNFTRVKLVEPDHNGVDRLIFFGFLPAQTSTIQAAKNSTNYKGWDYGYYIASAYMPISWCTLPSTTASPGQWIYDRMSYPTHWTDIADPSRDLFDLSNVDVDAPAAWGTDALPVRDIVCPTTSSHMAVYQAVAARLGCIFYPRWIDVGKTPTIGHQDPAYRIIRKEAEDYDAGGEGVGYHDTTAANLGGAYRKDGVDIEYFASEAGYNVGWIRDGEWLQYTVNFPVADTYVARFRTASAAATGARSFKVYLDGALVDTISVDGTGSYSTFDWNTDTCDVVIGTAGNHTIKLLFDNAGDDVADLLHMNLAAMEFTPTPEDTGTTPPTTVPALYWCDEADLDTALGLPVIEIPPYDPTLAGAVKYAEDMSDVANAVVVRYHLGTGATPDEILETTDWIADRNGLEHWIEHVETVEAPISTATAEALRDALLAYFAEDWGTVTAKFIRRTDLQLFQRLWFRGHDQIPEYEDDGTTPVLFRIVDISYSVGLAKCDVAITAVPVRKFAIEKQIARTRAPDPATEIEAIARSVLKTLPPALTGTAGSAVGTGSVAVALDRGGTITARGVAASGSRVVCTWADGIGYVASVIAAAL